ncbi:MAG: hypothetical protein ACR2Q3_09525 [Woeseiaceae bacterium]
MQDIFWGVVIIGIGLVMGGSVFLGEFSLFNIFFDGLGVFFIGKGAISMMGAKEDAVVSPVQPTAMQSVDKNEGTADPVE